MLATFGFIALCLACIAATLQMLLPWLVDFERQSSRYRKLAMLQFGFITFAFFALMLLRVVDDFSVVNVAEHSNRALPLLYKITGTWGNHEGSMLLWVLILAAYGHALSIRKSPLNPKLIHAALSVQAALAVGFLLFIMLTSNPFIRQADIPFDGSALNPLLQDIGLAMHPPMLYLGYVGFSIVFSLAVGALVEGELSLDWSRFVRPFLIFAWSALTLGIGLGSWWAYRELGWGGWWFWDPVENASLLPWLAGTALLHCNISHERRGVFKQWIILLAIFTFALSLLGTFLVRSGVLTSVHSFASDPARGFYILGYMTISIGGALTLYGFRVQHIDSGERVRFLSREGQILINNLFLITTCLTILFGTLYPLIAEWWSGRQLTVGAPYFNRTALPLMVLPIILAGVAPFLPWQGGSLSALKKRLMPALVCVSMVCLLVMVVVKTKLALALLGFGLAGWLAAFSIMMRVRNLHIHTGSAFRDAAFFAHLGVAVLVAGITAEGLYATQAEAELHIGESLDIGGYSVMVEGQHLYRDPNYMAKRADISLRDSKGNHITWLYPEFRMYPLSGSTTSESTIYALPWQDIYVVIGQSHSPDLVGVRVYIKPGMLWLWAGFALMAFGGFASVLPKIRRRRI